MGKPKQGIYKAIPEPKADLASLLKAVQALRENVQTLTGQNTNVEGLDERVTKIIAKAENSFSQYYSNVQVVAKKNYAMSQRIEEVNAAIDDGWANGKIIFKAQAAPGAFKAKYSLMLTASADGADQGPEVETGFSILAEDVGGVRTSSIGFTASQFMLHDPTDNNPKPVFKYLDNVFRFNVPVEVRSGNLAFNSATLLQNAVGLVPTSAFVQTTAIDHIDGASYWVFAQFDGRPDAQYNTSAAMTDTPRLRIFAFNPDTADLVQLRENPISYSVQALSGGGFTYRFLYTGVTLTHTPPNSWARIRFRVYVVDAQAFSGTITIPLTITAMASKR